MRIYYDENLEPGPNDALRTHPWQGSSYDKQVRYYNFVENPELIDTSLEDFTPWNSFQAVQTFYDFLRWVNGPESVYETNDCGFRGITPSNDTHITEKRLKAHARLMLLYRRHVLNTNEQLSDYFGRTLWEHLERIDPDFELGVVGFVKYPTVFTELPGLPADSPSYLVALYFWTWGDDEAEAMANLDRVFNNLWEATKQSSEKTKKMPLTDIEARLLKRENIRFDQGAANSSS